MDIGAKGVIQHVNGIRTQNAGELGDLGVINAVEGVTTVAPILDLNFAGTKQLDPRITFTRASTASYIDSDKLVKLASNDQPRFDHDAISGVCKGLLIEEQRTNQITYSEDFSNAAWAKTRSSITSNAIISPDGTLSADKLVEDSTASNSHYIRENISAADNTVYTASVFVKAGERTVVTIVLYTKSNLQYGRYFDLSTGTITANSTGFTGLSTGASITNVGNGWYRCSVTHDIGSGVNPPSIRIFIVESTSIAYNGDGTSGLYIWGAQVEEGAFSTSYIPSTSATTTRLSDSASITGSDFYSWYNQSEGTIYCEILSPNVGNGQRNSLVWGTLASIFYTLNGAFSLRSYDGTTVIQGGIVDPSIKFKASFGYSSVGMAQYKDGNSAGSTTLYDGNLGDSLSIGSGEINALNGYISKLTYYPKRLSNTILQTLTK